MGIKHKKLKQWVEAGLIGEDQAANIQAFENTRKAGKFGRGMVGLAIFAIGIGILSIIASNWYLIPPAVKIAAHVLLNLIVGFVAFRAHQKGNEVWREAASLLFLGLSMTLIILIGQIYQLGGSAADAFTLWIIITLPFFLLLANSYMTAVPWMIAFLMTIAMVMMEKLPALPEQQQQIFVFGMSALFPLALVADGGIGAFRRWKPALSDLFMRCGQFLMVLNTSVAIIAWQYMDRSYIKDLIPLGYICVIAAAGFAGIFMHALLHRFYRDDPVAKLGAIFAAVSLLIYSLPFIFPLAGGGLLSAFLFVGYWMFIGWIAQTTGNLRLVSFSISVIALRIFIIYVELFGGLMLTGVGLIISGVVMLGMIYGAKKLNTRLTGKGARNVPA